MRWKTYKRPSKSRPFLVLPIIENNYTKDNKMPKRPNLKLFTKTWPTKDTKKCAKEEDSDRPLTATLDKPQILDINFLGKIDMSLMRNEEFLCIANLYRLPLTVISTAKTSKRSSLRECRRTVNRPVSLPGNNSKKRSKRIETSEDSWEDEESSASQSARKTKISKTNAKVKVAVTLTKPKISPSDSNNNKIGEKRVVKTPVDKTSNVRSTKLPEPCKTCGRPEQPERFHSHPVAPPPQKAIKKMDKEVIKVPHKNIVQKPVAIKYKSKLSTTETPPKVLPKQRVVHNPAVSLEKQEQGDRPRTRSGKGPRTLICYLCGREFGTASLPLHEPKCLQKWERENATLPPQLRRKTPPKPDHTLSQDEWNLKAWEASKASLVPCNNCGRTFLPDRLLVHQRSCKSSIDMVS